MYIKLIFAKRKVGFSTINFKNLTSFVSGLLKDEKEDKQEEEDKEGEKEDKVEKKREKQQEKEKETHFKKPEEIN